MDLQGMKRKQLQMLCKKHGLPANLTNAKMMDSLAKFFAEGEVTSVEDPLESSEEEVREDSKKTGKKVTFFLEGNQIHQFVHLDPEEEGAELPKQGKGRKKRGSARCVVLPSVKTRRQSMAVEIRSPVLQRKKAAVKTSMQEGSAKSSDGAVVGHVTRSLRGREIIISVEMGKPSGQVGSKKRKSLATKGVENVDVVKSYARTTRSKVQKSETSEEELKFYAEMDRVPDQGDVKKRKNQQEADVTVINQARTRVQVQSAKNKLLDEIRATKVEDLKIDGFRGGSKSRKKVSGEEACSSGSNTPKETKAGLQCREILRRSKRNALNVSGEEACSSGSNTPKETKAGLQCRDILRRSKRNASNAVDLVVNIMNEQDGILEGRRRKKRGNPLEKNPINSKDRTLDDEKESMHVEDALVEPQSAHSRRSTRHVLKSPTSSLATERNSSKKARDRAAEPLEQTPISFKHNILDDGKTVGMNVDETLAVSQSQHSRRSTRHALKSPTSSRAFGISSTKRARDRATKTLEQTPSKPNILDDDEVGMHVKDTLVEPQFQPSTRSKLRSSKSPSSNHQNGVSSTRKARDKTSEPLEQTPNCSKYSILDDGEGVGMHFQQTSVEPHPQHSRRSKCHVLKSPNSSYAFGISTENAQDIAIELPEQTPTSSEVCVLDNGEGAKTVEKTLDTPQSQNSRRSKCHSLISLTPSHKPRTSTTKKTRSNRKYQMSPHNCDVDNQNIQMVSTSTPITLSIGKEGSKVKLNNSAGKGFVSKANEVEQSIEGMDVEEHDEFENEVLEKDKRASQVENEIEENVIKTLGAPTISTDLVPGEGSGEECTSALEETSSLNSVEGKEFEYLTVRKAKEEEIDSHEAPFFPPNIDEKKTLENSKNFKEIHDCRYEIFEDNDPCHIRNEHVLHANDVSENPSAILGEVLSTNLGSEVDLETKALRDSEDDIFSLEKCEEPEMKKKYYNLGKENADNDELECKESLECETEDHLQVSVLVESGLIARFETLQEYAKESGKSADSLVEFEGTTNDAYVGQAAEEPIAHEVDSDTNVAFNGVKSLRLETLNDVDKEDNENYNSHPSMLQGSEDTKNEKGSAQSFDLSNENDSSDANIQPVNDDLNLKEEVNCEIVRKQNIKTCSDELVSEVQVDARILEVDNAETPIADFMVSDQEQSSPEIICNQEEPSKEATTPVWQNHLLRMEKCETNLPLSECDFKDELNENKDYEHDPQKVEEAKQLSHVSSLDFFFNDESAGVGAFEGYDHESIGGIAASFPLASGSIRNERRRGAELSNSENVFSQNFFNKEAGETSINRSIFEGQHPGKLIETNAYDVEEDYDREELNVSNMGCSRQKDTSMRMMKKLTDYEVGDLYNDVNFEMLSAIDSDPRKANILLGSAEGKISERKTINDVVKSRTIELCDSYHEISNDETVLAPCAADYEQETIIESEKGDRKEQERKDTESFESMAKIQINEFTAQEGYLSSNENTQDDKGADAFPDNIEESRAEADVDEAKCFFAEDNEVPEEETTQKEEEDLNEFMMKENFEDYLKDLVDTEINDDSFGSHGEEQKDDDSFGSHGEEQKELNPSLISKNGQGITCLDRESLENANRNIVTFEENIDNEAILHSKLDVKNDELQVDQVDKLVERKLIFPQETGRHESCVSEQLSNSGFEDD